MTSLSPQIYESHQLKKKWQLVSRHCGTKIPPPFITSSNQKQVKFTFFSDNVNYAQGFEFNYDYVKLPGEIIVLKKCCEISTNKIPNYFRM